MINGYQRTQREYKINQPSTDLIQPFTAQSFADFIAIDYTTAIKPVLDSFIQTAAEICVQYTNTDLLKRDWVYKLDKNPKLQAAFTGVCPMYAVFDDYVYLPIKPVTAIKTVKLNDETMTNYEFDLGEQARVQIEGIGSIEITYTAGYDLIPERLLLGIKMLAAYLFERRGACDATDAIKLSGAAGIWQPFVKWGGSI